ncbi:hypothetical protein EJB05_06232, partial [Eragrostis curvula]
MLSHGRAGLLHLEGRSPRRDPAAAAALRHEEKPVAHHPLYCSRTARTLLPQKHARPPPPRTSPSSRSRGNHQAEEKPLLLYEVRCLISHFFSPNFSFVLSSLHLLGAGCNSGPELGGLAFSMTRQPSPQDPVARSAGKYLKELLLMQVYKNLMACRAKICVL